LRRCLSRCRHCGIFFITDPRNAKRTDLGCPFGCREAHRKRSSTERSVAYYQSDVGKEKKRLQNDKRRGGREQRVAEAVEQAQEQGQSGSGWDGAKMDRVLVSYLAMVISLVEGRRVSREEVGELLSRVVRQHSIGRERRIDYVVRFLNEHPP